MLSDNIGREGSRLTFAGRDVTALAETYGTPLYLMDEGRIRRNCRMYLQAFRSSFGGDSLPLYASKAASFKQMYRIMAQEGMGVDTVSSGEIFTALSAGFPPERMVFHGNAKTDSDIRYAVSAGGGGRRPGERQAPPAAAGAEPGGRAAGHKAEGAAAHYAGH